jgi:hypothetical protein
MTNLTATLIETRQNHQNETTTYWFNLNGMDRGTEVEFNNDVIGIVDCNGDISIVGEEGETIESCDSEAIAISNCLPTTSVELFEQFGE